MANNSGCAGRRGVLGAFEARTTRFSRLETRMNQLLPWSWIKGRAYSDGKPSASHSPFVKGASDWRCRNQTHSCDKG